MLLTAVAALFLSPPPHTFLRRCHHLIAGPLARTGNTIHVAPTTTDQYSWAELSTIILPWPLHVDVDKGNSTRLQNVGFRKKTTAELCHVKAVVHIASLLAIDPSVSLSTILRAILERHGYRLLRGVFSGSQQIERNSLQAAQQRTTCKWWAQIAHRVRNKKAAHPTPFHEQIKQLCACRGLTHVKRLRLRYSKRCHSLNSVLTDA